MHVTWWHGFWAVLLISLAVLWGISSPRRARRLRDGAQDDMAIVKTRRMHKQLRWLFPFGVVSVAFAFLGFKGDWEGNVDSIATGLYLVVTGAVSFFCLRILDRPVKTLGD